MEPLPSHARPGARNLITDVPGLRVGQAQDVGLRGGVTVILPDAGGSKLPGDARNATIAGVATDLALTPAQARRVAIMAQDGLARAVARAVVEASPWPGADVACWRDLPAWANGPRGLRGEFANAVESAARQG